MHNGDREHAAFAETIFAAEIDDELNFALLVYADWLEEQGDEVCDVIRCAVRDEPLDDAQVRRSISRCADWLADARHPTAELMSQLADVESLISWDYYEQEPMGGMVISDNSFWPGNSDTRISIREFPLVIHRLLRTLMAHVAPAHGLVLKHSGDSYDFEPPESAIQSED